MTRSTHTQRERDRDREMNEKERRKTMKACGNEEAMLLGMRMRF